MKAQELTVAQARRLLLAEADRAGKAEDGEFDRLGESLFEDITLYEIAEITGEPIESFDELTPSELRKVADDCIKANPFFFSMRARERKKIEDLLAKNPSLLSTMMARQEKG